MQFFKKNRFSPSSITIIGLLLFTIVFFNFFKAWTTSHPFSFDCDQYYSYLVAFFIHGDLTFNFPNGYWLHEGPKGILIQKMSLGVALMEAPFFLIGHFIAKITGQPTDGYSAPYAYSVAFGIVLYVFAGLHFLKKALRYYYSEFATSLTLIGVFLGTNLFFYTVGYGTMSHSFLFSLFSLIIYSTIKWHQTLKNKYLYIGLCACGLATVIRPTQILMLLIPLLFGIHNKATLQHKLKLILSLKWPLLFGAVAFIIPIIPQIVYWKLYAGNWLYFSYTKEGFFFTDPKIWEVLFSYRKGWFVYTPIMLLALIGLFFYKNKDLKIGTWILFIVGLYILSSWWCWWYGGSYGMRSLIDIYPLLAFPLAFIFEAFNKSIERKILGIVVLSVFVYFSIIGTIQYKRTIIHWDSMTKESFWFSFNKISFNKSQREKHNALLQTPDYEGALEGKRNITKQKPQREKRIETFTLKIDSVLFEYNDQKELNKNSMYSPGLNCPYDSIQSQIKPDKKIILQSKIKVTNNTTDLAVVFNVIRNKDHLLYASKEFTTSSYPEEEWSTIEAEFTIPQDIKPTDIIKVYAYITKGDDILLKELKIGRSN